MMELKIAKGKFIGTNGVVESFSENRVVSNGWLVKILEDSSIEAVSKEKHLKGSVKVTISPDGLGKIERQLPGAGGQLENELKLPKKISQLRGTLCFTTGPLEKRTMFFKSYDFESFMKKNNLTASRKKEPNREFVVSDVQKIFTDGTVEEKGGSKFLVNDATWVIIYNETGEKVLYSTVYFRELVLPKFVKEGTEKKYICSLKRNFKTPEEAKKYMRRNFDFNFLWENDDKVSEIEGCESEEVVARYYLNEEEGSLLVKLYKNCCWKDKDKLPKGVKISYDQKRDLYYHGELLLNGSVWIATV